MLVPAKPVPPSPVQGAPSVLLKIEERLASAVSPQDVVLWAQVRGEILRQDDQRDLQRHNQSSERIRLLTKSWNSPRRREPLHRGHVHFGCGVLRNRQPVRDDLFPRLQTCEAT
jgi:hypothetical protein